MPAGPFKDIDVNCDGKLGWSEFTYHLIDIAKCTVETKDQQKSAYETSPYVDTTAHGNIITSMKYIPQLDLLVILEKNSSVFKLYNLDLTLNKAVRGNRGMVLDCAYIPESRTFVTSSTNGTLTFWSTSRQQYFVMLHQWDLKKPQVGLRTDIRHLYSWDIDGGITVWSPDRAESKLRLTGHTDIVTDIIVVDRKDATGDLLVSSSEDATLRMWDLITGEQIEVLKGHEKAVHFLVWCEECQTFLSAGLDSYILTWNLEEILRDIRVPHKILPRITADGVTYTVGLEAIPNSPRVVIVDNDGVFRIFDLVEDECVQMFKQHKSQMVNLSLTSKDLGQHPMLSGPANIHEMRRRWEEKSSTIGAIAVCREGKNIVGCKGTKGTGIFRFDKVKQCRKALDSDIIFADYNPYDMTIITVSETCVKWWNALTGRLVTSRENIVPELISAACINDNGRKLFVATQKGTLYVLNYQNCGVMKQLDTHEHAITDIRYSHHCNKLFVACWGGLLVEHDADGIRSGKSTGHIKDTLKGSDVTCLALSDELGLVATGSSDGRIAVYKSMQMATTGRLCDGHDTGIVAMEFVNSHSCLVSSDQSGKCILWHTPYNHTGKNYMRIAQWTNTDDDGESVVLCMRADSSDGSLWMGDDSGQLAKWSLSSLLACLPSRHGQDRQQRGGNRKCWNKTENWNCNKYGFLKDLNPERSPELTLSFRAHQGQGVKDLRLTRQSASSSIMSYDFDGNFEVWDKETGENTGRLQAEGADDYVRWQFKPNINQHRDDKKDELKNLSKTLKLSKLKSNMKSNLFRLTQPTQESSDRLPSEHYAELGDIKKVAVKTLTNGPAKQRTMRRSLTKAAGVSLITENTPVRFRDPVVPRQPSLAQTIEPDSDDSDSMEGAEMSIGTHRFELNAAQARSAARLDRVLNGDDPVSDDDDFETNAPGFTASTWNLDLESTNQS